MPIRVQGVLVDMNGIASADLYLQQGGAEETVIIPMVALNDSIFEASIADSLVTIKNFRAFIRGNDNMANTGESDRLTPSVKYGDTELTTMIDNSIYPNGFLPNTGGCCLFQEAWIIRQSQGQKKTGTCFIFGT